LTFGLSRDPRGPGRGKLSGFVEADETLIVGSKEGIRVRQAVPEISRQLLSKWKDRNLAALGAGFSETAGADEFLPFFKIIVI
jgi:hypothetical protein